MPSQPDSPRTAEALSKSRAFSILRATENTAKAIRTDKQWASQYEDLQKLKDQRSKEHANRIVARQREVGRSTRARHNRTGSAAADRTCMHRPSRRMPPPVGRLRGTLTAACES